MMSTKARKGVSRRSAAGRNRTTNGASRRGGRAADGNGSHHLASRSGGSVREGELRRIQSHPKPPMPKQHQESPGIEAKVHPRPQYTAPLYKGADKLAGKVALISGGDSGIGRAVAVLFAREGADVAIMFLPEEQSDADETRAAIEAEGRRSLLLPGDVTDAEYCERCVEEVVNEFGSIDILVNNAAFQKNQESIEDIDSEQL